MRTVRITIALVALATAASLLTATRAEAGGGRPAPEPSVLTTAVGAPFNLEVDRGRILIADGGPGLVGKLLPDGTVATVIGNVPGAAGVATSRKHLAWTTTDGDASGITASGVSLLGPGGIRVDADTLAHERASNPDGIHHYGVTDPSPCVSDALAAKGFPVSYTGLVDSHAYSLVAHGTGFVLADAGANALFRISRTGRVTTLAVLPPHPAKITRAAADALGLPDCVVGVTYRFEAVPTDVEVGPDGHLYVTTLPGGPEDPSLGARGKVFRVNPWTGRTKQVASGLLGPTNLAFAGGRLYVTELFAGRLSQVRHGRVKAWLDLPGAIAVEAGPRGTLYVGTGITGPGSIVQVGTRSGWRH